VVEKDGSIVFDPDPKKVILRDPGGGCGDEAFKVVKKMPSWVPGRQRNNPVRVQFTLPIKFKLAD
jgi:protein TonB